MPDLLTFDRIGPADAALVGGKALSLASLTAAGLPVPPGFCLTTAARRIGPDLVAALAQEHDKLGAGPVAVRSSATAEDGAVSSFAGQQETVLGVLGFDALLQAIDRCRASLDSERAVAYRRQQGVRDDGLAMAVVVQKLVPAEVAGVLFTRDPLDPAGGCMLVEASWGLGESVVSGRVTPDRFHLDRDTGKVLDRHIAVKTFRRTAEGEEAVPAEKQGIACLDDEQLARLAELGRQVEAHHGEPRDVEWALAEGRFWLLQSRPITASGRAERERVRQEEIAALRAKAAPLGTVWARFNLSEVLPAPTPITWSIVSRYLMSGKGGFGLMYRDLGFDPDPALDDEGVFDLVCGRPYCNLSREPRLHYRGVPLEHSFAALKADPRRALYPTPTLNPARFPWHFWLFLPLTLPRLTLRILLGGLRRKRLKKTFAARFRKEVVPAFLGKCREWAREGFAGLDDAAVLQFLQSAVRGTLVEFARDSLKPTALAALAMADLERQLAEVLGAERASGLVRDLAAGVKLDPEADFAGGLHDLAAGRLAREAFLERFGRRGSEEMELARPRWAEEPAFLDSLTRTAAPHEPPSAEERLKAESRLNAEQRALVLRELASVHEYVRLRETAKHHLMHGYSLIRKALLELDRRHGLGGGIFFLTEDELPRLLKGEELSAVIAQRRRRRMLALGLEVPAVLFSDDLEAIGRPVAADGAELMQGVPLSAGVAEAKALVLEEPRLGAAPAEEYILVCPSTDPAWVPLFVRARGLVMETGGVLSHGAIVAREFGLPAVAGLPGVLRRVRTGQRLRVDGAQGTVALLGSGERGA
jgi:pyruvate,water dikinase